jgi:hypothetical protein
MGLDSAALRPRFAAAADAAAPMPPAYGCHRSLARREIARATGARCANRQIADALVIRANR